jgi:hypothetical protein
VGQPCTVCTSPTRHAIDVAIVAGTPNRRIAALFDVSEQAVRRHRAVHLPAAMARARDAAELADADDLVAQVRALQARALAILDEADAAGERRTALAAIRETRATQRLVAQLTGALRERVVIEDEKRVYVAEWGKSDLPPLHAAPAAIDVTSTALASPDGGGTPSQ